MSNADNELARFLEQFDARYQGLPEFRGAVAEVAASVLPDLAADSALARARPLERLTVPDRIIAFRVCWEDDAGEVRVNRGYRVQHSNAVGPYKGGLRFHPQVNLDTLQALAFEQTFKNSLTGLPMGGAKGGADFDPRGRSDAEIMRFCRAFMTELYRHIGPDTDVPAGDLGVGAREIGFLFGQYKHITGTVTAAMTGKGVLWGGSQVRAEATGYGVVYFLQHVLARQQRTLEGLGVAVSGAGNVALHAAEKLCAAGARVLTLSDSRGALEAGPEGFSAAQLAQLKSMRTSEYLALVDCAGRIGARYVAGQKAWATPCDIAMPCATQNELDENDARTLAANGCHWVIEGANLPVTAAARAMLRSNGIVFVPGKAANAGGVAVSGLEISQNRMSLPWERADIEQRLQHIMARIHEQCLHCGETPDGIDYALGANRAGFRRVARAMLAFGIQ